MTFTDTFQVSITVLLSERLNQNKTKHIVWFKTSKTISYFTFSIWCRHSIFYNCLHMIQFDEFAMNRNMIFCYIETNAFFHTSNTVLTYQSQRCFLTSSILCINYLYQIYNDNMNCCKVKCFIFIFTLFM